MLANLTASVNPDIGTVSSSKTSSAYKGRGENIFGRIYVQIQHYWLHGYRTYIAVLIWRKYSICGLVSVTRIDFYAH